MKHPGRFLILALALFLLGAAALAEASDGNALTAQARDWNSYFSVSPGQSATLQVDASCERGDLHYQWSEYTQDAGEQALEGASGDALTVLPSTHYTRYTCRVSDDYGNSASVRFDVYIYNHLYAMALGSSDVGVGYGETAELRVSAGCLAGELHYQWYDASSREITGATSSVYITDPVTERRRYECRVTDDYGGSESVDFYAFVENGLRLEGGEASEYIRALPGEDLTLSVNASCDTGELSYNWWLYGESTEWLSDTDTATVPNIQGSCFVDVDVRDEFGSYLSKSFHILLDTGLVVDAAQYEVWVPYGETARLDARAYCDYDLTYAWAYTTDDDPYDPETEALDETGSTLATDPITSLVRYFCRVEDGYGNEEKIEFRVGVENHLTAEAVGDTDVVCPLGETRTLTVQAQCDTEPLTYAWLADAYREEFGGWDGSEIEGANAASLTLDSSVCRGDNVVCVVRDQYGGTVYVPYQVSFESGLVLDPADEVVVLVPEDGSVTLHVDASTSAASLTYLWKNNDRDVDGADGPSFTATGLSGITEIRCYVNDSDGNYDSAAFLCAGQPDGELALDTDVSVTFGEGESRTYAFVPAETGYYALDAPSGWASLYDAGYTWLRFDYEADGGWAYPKVARLTAGQRYYFCLYGFNYDADAFTARLSKVEDSAYLATAYMFPGQTVAIPPYYDPYDSPGPWDQVSLSTDDTSVLSVQGDRVTALAAGKARLNVGYSSNGGSWQERRPVIITVLDLPETRLPAGLRSIEAEAFAGDAGLRRVTLGDSVERIGRDAFSGSGMKVLVVPATGTTFTGGALRGVKDFTLVCRPGSRAESWALEHDLFFFYLP